MMARRWKQSQPEGVSATRDMSGPRETVRSKKGRSSSLVSSFFSKPMMEHIKSTSEICLLSLSGKRKTQLSPKT